MPIRILREWWKWRKDWESLCKCCGKCCYVRFVCKNGEVIIDYNDPCEYLDTQTQLCRVYEDRFHKCDCCGKVTLLTALFNPTLPNDCAYVETFRLWKKKSEKIE